MNKHELSAWWRFGLSCVHGAYLFWLLFFASQEAISTETYYRPISMLLFLALVYLSAWYLQRRKGVDQDERDRAISMTATRTALLALLLIVGLTPLVLFEIILGAKESITLDLGWSYFYVYACLTLVIWLEAAITVFHHWHDRRQAP